MIKKLNRIINWQLVIIIILMISLSVVTLKLGLPYYAKKPGASSYWYKQILFMILGFGIAFIIYKYGGDRLYSGMWVIYGVLMFFLLLLVIERFSVNHFGVHIVPLASTVGGATSWFNFPGFSFQPSEFMKIAMIIVMSQIIDEHNQQYLVHEYSTDIKLIGKVMAVALPPCLLVYLQNDAGVAMIMLSGVVFILFAAGIKRNWFIIAFIIATVVILLMAYLFVFHQEIFSKIITGHKLDRFYGWVDPAGTYQNQGYQLYNAQMAYGTAGMFGHGFKDVIITLQEPQTDFIFALITLGFGFAGGLLVIALTLALDFTILNIAAKSNSKRDQYFIAGVFGFLIFQQFWNIAMILGLLPITGITLPFFSYGGSSILSYMIAMGLILWIHKQNYILEGKNRYN
ncbi:MAG: FtsW/RodA/SpoVE family cell cycle protein [Thomasclavelia sp.]|nr:FtsW/RodA/SpoVE family cell cycle protein [Thomasclavelia sp.]